MKKKIALLLTAALMASVPVAVMAEAEYPDQPPSRIFTNKRIRTKIMMGRTILLPFLITSPEPI